ncbi:MAG: non-homologous end-joining DNA ligase [Bacteroidota bacterium]
MAKRRYGRYTVETSNEDRILFPDADLTKGELIDHYEAVGSVMVPHVKDRPLSMKRFPEGIEKDGFFQQKSESYFPDWIERVEVAKEDGRITHAMANKTATLVYLAQLGTITPHVWLSRVDDLQKPDQIIFDLDPPEGGDFGDVRTAARNVRDYLEEHDLKTYVMTTGSKGLHVRAPIRRDHTFDEVRNRLREMAADLAECYPDALTVEHRKNKRAGRVYLDILRVAYGQTAVPPYAVRARKDAPVATPLEWSELDDVGSASFTIRDIAKRLDEVGDPWEGMFKHARSLSLS